MKYVRVQCFHIKQKERRQCKNTCEQYKTILFHIAKYDLLVLKYTFFTLFLRNECMVKEYKPMAVLEILLKKIRKNIVNELIFYKSKNLNTKELRLTNLKIVENTYTCINNKYIHCQDWY